MQLKKIEKFLISPDNFKYSFNSSGEKIRGFIKLFGINLLLSFIILSTLTSLIRLNFEIKFKIIDLSFINLCFANLLLIPVLEEIAFRLSLKLNNIYLSLSVSVIFFIILSYYLGIDIIDFKQNIVFRFAVALMVFFIIYLLLRNKIIFKKVIKVWEKSYRLIFYLFLFLFVVRHVDMYELNFVTFLFLPLLISPQLVSGVFLSFVRIRFGFGFAIIFHLMINLIAFSPQIVLYVFNNS